MGVRGVYATTDVNGGDTVIAVPLESSISVRPGESCPFTDFVPNDVWVGLPWYAQLALKLLHERALGAASRFADYLPALPPSAAAVDLPATWPPAAVRALQYPYLQEQVVEEQQEWGRLAATLRPHLARRGLGSDDLAWALSCVRSRTFAGPHFPTPPPLKLSAGAAAAAAVAAAEAALGLGGSAAAFAPAALVGLGLPAAWQAAESKQAEAGAPGTVLYSVCPFIDMFNHDSRSQSECVFAPWKNQFRVVAGGAVRRGGQLLISYGSQSNDALLQRYGFVQLEGNPHDRYVFQDLVAAVAALAEAGGVPGLLPAAAGEDVRAAARSINAPPGSLDQVPLTPGGEIPPATAQALSSLLGALSARLPEQQPTSSAAAATPSRLVAELCTAQLRSATTSLADDEAALAQLSAWEAWEAGAEERAARAAARAAAAEAAAAAAAAAAAEAAALAAAGIGAAEAAAVAAAAAGVVASANRSTPQPATDSPTLAHLEAESPATAAPELESEPEPEPVLPPAELEQLGGEAGRLRSVLQFRVAKKRVLAALSR
ncbi:hypothetical protein HYH02_007928 [Chlamydomonas schloesseri]|uniref:SET domain-containing protein n=1 Tax=Chlamydomonas schloesseri TaxID=2026947 RepID=A0A836B487_9CHLO|nr:hypothetical protein HYH02_007928 [Chlamydomonas schloesseri]|eukprot:KAG2447185.1 hypothetical protein HYH02_007928 [Chlamydomonas schloesseri]